MRVASMHLLVCVAVDEYYICLLRVFLTAHVLTRAPIYVLMYACMRVCMRVCAYLCYVSVYVCVYMCMCARVVSVIDVCVCVVARIRTMTSQPLASCVSASFISLSTMLARTEPGRCCCRSVAARAP